MEDDKPTGKKKTHHLPNGGKHPGRWTAGSPENTAPEMKRNIIWTKPAFFRFYMLIFRGVEFVFVFVFFWFGTQQKNMVGRCMGIHLVISYKYIVFLDGEFVYENFFERDKPSSGIPVRVVTPGCLFLYSSWRGQESWPFNGYQATKSFLGGEIGWQINLLTESVQDWFGGIVFLSNSKDFCWEMIIGVNQNFLNLYNNQKHPKRTGRWQICPSSLWQFLGKKQAAGTNLDRVDLWRESKIYIRCKGDVFGAVLPVVVVVVVVIVVVAVEVVVIFCHCIPCSCAEFLCNMGEPALAVPWVETFGWGGWIPWVGKGDKLINPIVGVYIPIIRLPFWKVGWVYSQHREFRSNSTWRITSVSR